MVKDINPSGISYFYSFADVGGMLYFSADDMVNGVELWKSDGTAAGTVMVKDICPGSTGSSSLKLTDVGGTLYFSANDGTNGFELWKSDGTEAGTVMVKDINPSDASSSPNYLINIDGTLYFQANDGVYGAELWKIASILLVPTTLDLTAADYQIASDGFSETDVTVYIEDQGGSPLDGITVYFNTNNGTLNSVSETTEGGYASVTLTSDFSEDEIIIATVTATADGLSDATAVFFVPSGQMVNDIETEIVNGSGTLEGTLTGGNIAIDADGEHIVTVAEYQGNPQDDTVFKVAGNFVDVHLNDADGVNWVTIQFCPANPNTKIFYWDGSGWPEASNYTYDETSGCVIVTITSTTQPSLSDLAGLIFVPGETVVEVEIDIKPGSDPNSINLRSKGVVPVAILTTDTFDAADVDPVTVTFAGASPLRWAMEDIDSDGDTDIVFYFKTQELALDSESVEAILEGSTFSGPDIEGVDSVKIPAGSK
jgi:ELWxxDGT repeat protein